MSHTVTVVLSVAVVDPRVEVVPAACGKADIITTIITTVMDRIDGLVVTGPREVCWKVRDRWAEVAHAWITASMARQEKMS